MPVLLMEAWFAIVMLPTVLILPSALNIPGPALKIPVVSLPVFSTLMVP